MLARRPDLVHLALLTGCRYGELGRLRVADYNPDVGSLTIRDAKSGQARARRRRTRPDQPARHG
jgi:integrase